MGDIPGNFSHGMPHLHSERSSSGDPPKGHDASQRGGLRTQSGGAQSGQRAPYQAQYSGSMRQETSPGLPQQYQTGNFMNMNSVGGALPDADYASSYGVQHPQIGLAQGNRYLGQPFQYAGQSPSVYSLQQQQGLGQGLTMQHAPSQQQQQQQQQYYQYQQASRLTPMYAPSQGLYTQPVHQYMPSGYSQPGGNHGMAPERSSQSSYRGAESETVGESVSTFASRGGSLASALSGRQSTARGPPRKPKQSGHALWVGNLPPTANVLDLKDHFSRDATDDILSVFLISKSNCAFVNYKTEQSCASAMARFHDSKFQSTRLVCRLRRVQANSTVSLPAGNATPSTSQVAFHPEPVETSIPDTDDQTRSFSNEAITAKDRYFIVKSLTIEDLQMSVRTSQWATQSHNESALNTAYKNADNVYLIFSANKSGEYFGYARMSSPINEDPEAAIRFAPRNQTVDDSDQPKAIPTPASETAPKGRIIDDSVRGSIFWEAETEENDFQNGEEEQGATEEIEGEEDEKAWGKPFKIDWMSTARLPFYRTRGLRNPWNSNREVKIARDGTELETSVGDRLVRMFHQEVRPAPLTASNMALMGPASPMGYAPMRPY